MRFLVLTDNLAGRLLEETISSPPDLSTLVDPLSGEEYLQVRSSSLPFASHSEGAFHSSCH